MKFGIWPNAVRPWKDIQTLVVHCDRTGWNSAYLPDHLMEASDTEHTEIPSIDCWAGLTALATVTKSIRLGSLVSPISFRHPSLLAKTASSAHVISNGRITLGIGAGWQAREHEAFGLHLPAVSERLDRLEEAAALIASLLSQDHATLGGKYYKLNNATCKPRLTEPPVRLLIGGGGERRTMAIAARHADEWNAWFPLTEYSRKSALLDQYCEAAGRDPKAVDRSTQAYLTITRDHSHPSTPFTHGRPVLRGTPAQVLEQVSTYATTTIGELIIRDTGTISIDAQIEMCDIFMDEVVQPIQPD